MQRKELFSLILILLLAFSFRFVGAGVPVLNGDEADNYDAVRNIFSQGLHSPWQRWAGLLPPMALWVMSVFVKFGNAEWIIRLYGAVFGTLTVFAVYFLARLHFGKQTAIISGLLSAVLPLLVLSNRDAHPDNVLIFFTLAAVTFWEYGRIKNPNHSKLRSIWKQELGFFKPQTGLFSRHERQGMNPVRAIKTSTISILLGGISAGLAVLSKYNSIALFGMYWLFFLKLDWRKTVRPLAVSVLLTGIVITISFGEFTNAVYFVHGIVFWLFNQNLEITAPWHYALSILFDGLSPLVFILLPIAALLTRKEKKMKLHIWLCFLFITLVTIQGRKFPRHLLLAMPFAVIIISHALYRINLKTSTKIILISIIITSTGGWTVYKALPYQNLTVWREAGQFILDMDATKVFVDGIEFWPLKYYTGYKINITSKLHEELLQKGDMVIIHSFDKSTPFITGSPLQNDLTIFSQSYAAQYKFNEEFYSYAQAHGKMLKKIPYDSLGNEISIIQITSTEPIQRERSRQLDVFTKKICNLWNTKGIPAGIMQIFLPAAIQKQVEKKCTKGCVSTCDIM